MGTWYGCYGSVLILLSSPTYLDGRKFNTQLHWNGERVMEAGFIGYTFMCYWCVVAIFACGTYVVGDWRIFRVSR